jgi:hypothetical protein
MCVPLTRVFRLQSPDTISWRGWPLKVDGTQIKHRKLARAASITPPCVNRAANSHQVTKYQRVLPTLRQQYSKDLPSARIWLPAFRDSRSSSPDPFIFEQPCLIYAFNGQDRWPDVLSRLQRLQRPPKPHFCLATLCIPLSTRISWLYSRQHSALFRPVHLNGALPFEATSPNRVRPRTILHGCTQAFPDLMLQAAAYAYTAQGQKSDWR